ncbi:MAG: 16S rRNA (cytidine(1402)-2'-O)-methyltransferase [Bacteriovoracaceae bacterium]
MGKIILLNTPIGNLSDLTPRVRAALESGEFFAAEDTRVFKELLNHLGISVSGKKIVSLHDQSEKKDIQKLLELAQSQDVYVASEAGSPIISDPAFPLVTAAIEKGIEIDSFSGVSSPVMALELSGLPPLPFQFHGFLPRESGKRTKIFSALSGGTHIFFEAPTRIEDTMEDLAEMLPDAQVALVRELSKKFQDVLRFRANEWPSIKERLTVKGEFVLVLHKQEVSAPDFKEMKELAQEILAKGAGPKVLAKLLSAILDRPTKEIYSSLTRQNKDD